MERRKVKGMIMIMILSTVFSMFYTIRHTTDRLNLTEVEAHAGTGILEDPEYDVFPYISFVTFIEIVTWFLLKMLSIIDVIPSPLVI